MNMTRRKFGVIGIAEAVSNTETEAMGGVSDDMRGKAGAVVKRLGGRLERRRYERDVGACDR